MVQASNSVSLVPIREISRYFQDQGKTTNKNALNKPVFSLILLLDVCIDTRHDLWKGQRVEIGMS